MSYLSPDPLIYENRLNTDIEGIQATGQIVVWTPDGHLLEGATCSESVGTLRLGSLQGCGEDIPHLARMKTQR